MKKPPSSAIGVERWTLDIERLANLPALLYPLPSITSTGTITLDFSFVPRGIGPAYGSQWQ